jgi:RNA polymerase sigma-70 factor (ECF subfamily)
MAPDSRDSYDVGRQAWPGIALDEARYRYALGTDHSEPVHAADLYLACAAAAGIAAATEAFERHFMSRVPLMVAHMKLPPHAGEELCQKLRELLLLPRNMQPPKLAEYAGRGSLSAWLRVVAVRAALDQLRAEQRRATDELDDELPFFDGAGDEPELQLLRTHFRPRFAEALRFAASALTPRQRNVLRLSLVDGLTLEQMAPVFGVTKSTVHRWIGQAHRHFLRNIHRFFRDEMGLSVSEVESVARLLQSQVELSLPSLLRTR